MRARKRFGQHFLEAAWVRKMADLVAPTPGQPLVEIGPGRGALTRALLERGASVVAIELDRDLAAALEAERLAGLSVVAADVLRVDLRALVREANAGAPVRFVGNLPYNISTPILVQLVEVARAGAPLADATLMLQREVADRLSASPGSGDYGPLSIAVQLWADVVRLLDLPPGAFRPPPKVHSAVVRLTFRAPALRPADVRTFDGLVRASFTQRRKTLGNAVRAFATGRGAEAAALLARAGVDAGRRPETLSIEEWIRLADALPPAADQQRAGSPML